VKIDPHSMQLAYDIIPKMRNPEHARHRSNVGRGQHNCKQIAIFAMIVSVA
jgi:hypothetical protein